MISTDFDVRVLAPTDIDPMRGMLAMFGVAFGDTDTYAARPPDDAYLRELLESRTFVAIAALAGDEVTQARSEFYVYDLAVAEAYRRRGVATALLREVSAPISTQFGADRRQRVISPS